MHHSSDLKSAAALAVQTAYDKSALRGRGFIYMSPDVGPRALAGAKSVERPWSRLDGQLFKVTILHELGHVAGLQHNAEANGLMGARTIEYLVDRDSVTLAEADPAARARFDDYVASLVPGSLVDFPEYSHFERCTSRECTRLIVSRRSEKSVIVDVWKAPAGTRSFWSDAGFTLMGSMELNAVQTEPVILSRIFKDKNYEPSITGQKVRFTGRYVANDGAGSDARPATMTWTTGNAPQLNVFDGSNIIPVFE
jgi:hypothetical protein